MRHSPFTAVYDACVLYPAPLRDFLMWLALSGRFRARWSSEIHAEWQRNLLAKRQDLTAAGALAPFGIEAQHPDEFIQNLFDLDPAAVIAAARSQRQQLKNPPMDVDRFLDVLLRQGLVGTVKSLSAYQTIL